MLRLFLAFLLFNIPFLLVANNPNYAISKIDESLLEDAHTVVRLEESTYTVSSPSKATQRVKKVVSIINKKSNQDVIYIYYNLYRKVKKFTCTLYSPSGMEIKSFKLKNLEDVSAISHGTLYSDARYKVLKFNHLKPPFTIEYEYEVAINDIMTYPEWELEYKTSIEKAIYKFEMPSDINLQYRAYNIDVKPELSTSEGTNYTWEIKNIKAIEKEPLSPPAYEVLPHIIVTPSSFQVEDYKGSYSSWKDYGLFLYNLNKGQDELSPEMAAKVQELIAEASTPEETIAILYQYIQDNMRYVSVQLGIGGWQTYDAQYVEKNKYGDCKALSNFMKSILHEAGITSNMAIIARGTPYRKHEPDFAHPFFNHAILYIPTENCWLECTSNNYPINYLGEDNEDRYALLITEEGGVLERTPAISSFSNTKSILQLESSGYAKISTNMLVRGSFQDGLREIGVHLSEEEKNRFLHRYSTLPSFEIEEVNITKKDHLPEGNLDYIVDVYKYASIAGKRMFVPLNLINTFTDIPKKMDDRKLNVVVKNKEESSNHFTFHLPSGYSIESYPKDEVYLESEFGTYKRTVHLEDNTIIYTRHLVLNAVNLSAEKYTDLRDFYKKVVKEDQAQMVLKKIDSP